MNATTRALLLGAVLMAVNGYAVAADETKYDLDPSKGIGEILTANIGKRVAFRLGSNDEIEGTVVKVGKNLVHVAKLTSREYYDAVISIEKISSIRVRMRDQLN